MIKWRDGKSPQCDKTQELNSRHDLIEITTLGDCPDRMFICKWCAIRIKEILNQENGSSEYYFIGGLDD